ncbi:MAG TPA: cupin domain-containing protein [Azospirillum sp.]|nr:cupin domain-containing protein [Azospirillum sp.]
MANRGEQLWFLDTHVTIRVSYTDGSGGVSVLEHQARHGDSPPLHVHHNEDEIFHIIDGEVRFRVGDDDLRAVAGETLLAPKGIPHSYLVLSGQGARLLTITRGGFERLVRTLSRPAQRSGLPDPSGPPTPEQAEALAQACREHGIELVGPPLH